MEQSATLPPPPARCRRCSVAAIAPSPQRRRRCALLAPRRRAAVVAHRCSVASRSCQVIAAPPPPTAQPPRSQRAAAAVRFGRGEGRGRRGGRGWEPEGRRGGSGQECRCATAAAALSRSGCAAARACSHRQAQIWHGRGYDESCKHVAPGEDHRGGLESTQTQRWHL